MNDIKYIDITEFREMGFLQEANRLFFHPLGLALEVNIDDDGTERLSGVWDYRDDPEGMVFDKESLSLEKWRNVSQEKVRHFSARVKLFGQYIQPLGSLE